MSLAPMQPSFFPVNTHIQDFDASNGSSSSTTCDFTPVVQAKGVDPLIAGSVIGSSIVLLLLVVVVLLIVCIVRHRKTKKSHDNDLDLSVNLLNPVYVPGGKLTM